MKPTHIIIVTIILFFKPVWSERTANFIEDLNYKEINEDVARQPPPDLELSYFFSGSDARYFVSNQPADAITAQETCKAKNNSVRLISIEDDEKFKEILPHLQATVGVSGIWTSGMETVFKESRDLLWSSNALPIDYTNFAPTLGHLLAGLHRARRGIHGGNHCNCENQCNERPTCEHVNCSITGETCTVEQPTCGEPSDQDCHLIEPKPACTVTCPECVLKRGDCVLIQPVCTVKEGTPNCTTTRRDHCTVIPAQYEVIPGKCKIIQEPCAVVQPEKPCDRPVNCTYQYNPHHGSNCGVGGNAPSFGQKKADFLLPGNCSMNCPPNTPCPNPCPPTEDKCYRVFNCVCDLICQAPPIICPPPIHHCLPAELVKVSDTIWDCDEPETICDPPIVECTQVVKKCDEDVITCPPPKTVCTPAVSFCPRPDVSCSEPVVECAQPIIDCPPLPQCEIPPGCYGNQGYPHTSSGCNCRGKREVQEKGALIAARCVALKKEFGFKWAIEECNAKYYFICEEPYEHLPF